MRIFSVDYLFNTKIRIIFVMSKDNNTMSKKQIKLTERERALIEAIRNYRASFPNGYPQLLWYCRELFDDLTDLPDDNRDDYEDYRKP